MSGLSDLQSSGNEFNSWPFHHQVTTLGKLFARICVCHKVV